VSRSLPEMLVVEFANKTSKASIQLDFLMDPIKVLSSGFTLEILTVLGQQAIGRIGSLKLKQLRKPGLKYFDEGGSALAIIQIVNIVQVSSVIYAPVGKQLAQCHCRGGFEYLWSASKGIPSVCGKRLV
jgi:hypothetical protein